MTTLREDLQALMDAPLRGFATLAPHARSAPGARRREPVPRGHFAPIGSGPAGETCGSCRHLFRRELAKAYLKCQRSREIWTGGRATDVRLNDAACRGWEAKS